MRKNASTPSTLEIHLLGPFRISVDGQAIDGRAFTRRKPKQLIKLLALQAHHQLHREQAMEALWPDADPESAANNLNKAIHMARHALEPELASVAASNFILNQGQQILLQAPGKVCIDVDEFELKAGAAIKSEDSAACEAAISLYGGDLLNEDAYEDWAATRREQLRERYHALLVKLSKIYESESDYQQSIEPLRKLVDSDPANEEAHRDLMRLYTMAGNRYQALRQYEQCVASLRRHVDAEPERTTVELQRQIESGRLGRLTHAGGHRDDRGAIESIAILPLLNDGADPEMEYLSDGLTENIINNLSQLPPLRVMAWGTVARFKGQETDPAEIGRTLGVRVVLTGRMRQLNERLIVRAELVDVADGAHLWGDAYDRKLADIFAMPEDIATEISRNLRFKLTGEDKQRLTKRHTENTLAYHAYLKGRYYWNKRTTECLAKGVDHFRQAIDLDPSYAAAYAGLSDSYTLLVVRESLPPGDGFARAKAAASMALRIDECFGEAHASLGHALLHNWEWREARKELQRAIEINPGYSSAHHWYSEYLGAQGDFETGILAAKRSEELDPLSLIITANVADVLYFGRQYDQAIKQAEKSLELDSTFWLTHLILGKSEVQRGMYPKAIEHLQKARDLLAEDAEILSALGFAYAAAGRKAEALKTLRQMIEQSQRRHVPPYHFGIFHAGLGNNDQAFDWLERAFEKHAVDLFKLKVEPLFDSLREDQRFPALLRRIGFE